MNIDYSLVITVLSVLITLISIFVALYQVYDGKKEFLQITKGRAMAIEGEWKGSFKQDNLIEGNELVGYMNLRFEVKGKMIQGKGIYGGVFTESESYEESITLSGGFKHSRFLVMDYKNINKTKTHFGYYILELSSEGNHLLGKLIAFGHKSETIISADIDLAKQL